MAVLLIAEHDNKSLTDAPAKALTAAKALGGPIDILVAGQGAKGVEHDRLVAINGGRETTGSGRGTGVGLVAREGEPAETLRVGVDEGPVVEER